MKSKKIIRKVLVLSACMIVAAGMIVLLAAANRERPEQVCKRVAISVRGDGEKMFIEKSDVMQQLKNAANGSLINKPLKEINLAKLERSLEKHSWIRDAELYFDSKDELHVIVSEREPIARVFTAAGSSFYIDSAGKRMPLLGGVSVRVPVVTNFSAAKVMNKKDSLMLGSIKTITKFLNEHPFWSAQIAQIDITPSATFELTPVVGNHIIRIGSAEQLEEKLDRLFLFYKQVLSKTGFDKYAVVDVQYKGQVIGQKNRFESAIDSLQLQKNIEALIEKSRQLVLQDSLSIVEEFNSRVKRDSSIKKLMESLEKEAENEKKILEAAALIKSTEIVKETTPVATKRATPKSKPVKATIKSKPIERQQPKAVMKKKES